MPNLKNNSPGGKGPGDPRVPPKTWLLWLVILSVIPLLVFFRDYNVNTPKTLTYPEFFQLVQSNLIVRGVIRYNPQSPLREISGQYRNPARGGALERFRIVTPLTEEREDQLLQTGKFRPQQPNPWVLNLVYGLLPVLLIALLLYIFFVRQLKSAGRGAFSFGKSRARMLPKEKNKTTFKDVAGIDEAVEEVAEIVEFLKDPKKFQRLGGRVPKGVLLVGPPGTGKTLLAKAIAGEADAAFFSISGSDFVEMFVGVGASRVRDMFEQARKHTPCLVFIDEIDAVGRSRGYGLGGGNDEREQTLNALLVEMDGFDTTEGIIVIAATNRPDILDPALLRPGRFDRQIVVNLPDVKGREAILRVHARKVKLAPDVDLSIIARSTPGFSGAELANLINEAALMAARLNKKEITMAELEEARDKVRWGRERRSMAMTEEQKRLIAWHEAGHALANVLCEHAYPLHKVSIIPRGQALGVTMGLPKDDVLNRSRKELLDDITVMVAGRIGEQIHTGDISTGAANDIQQATKLARSMVCTYGMSDRLGMVQYGEDTDYMFLGRDIVRSKDYSEQTAREIDDEVRQIIDQCYKRAEKMLQENRDKLEIIANALLEYETLEGWVVEEIVRTGKLPEKFLAKHASTPPQGSQPAPAGETQTEPAPPKIPPGFTSPAPAPA